MALPFRIDDRDRPVALTIPNDDVGPGLKSLAPLVRLLDQAKQAAALRLDREPGRTQAPSHEDFAQAARAVARAFGSTTPASPQIASNHLAPLRNAVVLGRWKVPHSVSAAGSTKPMPQFEALAEVTTKPVLERYSFACNPLRCLR